MTNPMRDRIESRQPPESGKPLPRYWRTGNGSYDLPGLLLQPRDLALLEDVWRYRWLTTSQIELLRGCDLEEERRFVSRLPLTRRLKLLFHHRYLRRIARPAAKGSQEPVYVLDTEGAKALRRQGQLGDEAVSPRAPSQLPKASALEHLLAVSQFRVCLTAACSGCMNDSGYGNNSSYDNGLARQAGAELVNWLSSDAVKFSVPVQEKGERVRQLQLIPDAFFTLRAQGQRLFYFLEVDLGTEPGKTLADKCRGYYLYWQSGGFARDFNVPPQVGFRVLFVVPGARRAETVLTAARGLPGGHAMFWIMLEEHVTPGQMLRPVFKSSSGAAYSIAGNRG